MKADPYSFTAEQARELGLTVGDTIQGREGVGEGWHDARITLLWIGSTHAAWIVSGRSSMPRDGDWSPPHEATNWDLGCREWERIKTPPEHAALLPAPATPPPLPPGYIDPEYQGEDRELLEAFYGAWQAKGATDERVLRSIRAVMALRPTMAAVRAADAAIADEALDAEFRAWWRAKVHHLTAPDYYTTTTNIAWGRHLLSRGGL